ncbi:MAG: hypothetical protein K2Y18_06515 [Alphaproteobacteria bacterium]|nr:hypothetical protein [Alphaproteobacteria bacterium]
MKRILLSTLLFSSISNIQAMEEAQSLAPFILKASSESVRTFKDMLQSNSELTFVQDIVSGFEKSVLPELPPLAVKSMDESELVSNLKSALHNFKLMLAEQHGVTISFFNVKTVEGLKVVLKESGAAEDLIDQEVQRKVAEEQAEFEKRQQNKINDFELYSQWTQTYGTQPLGLWNSFIYYVLGSSIKMPPGCDYAEKGRFDREEPLPLKARQITWDALRKSGIISTTIENPIDYRYNPAALLNAKIESSQARGLILGCGHFLTVSTLANLNLDEYEHSNCAGCREDHKARGEVTINIDATQCPDIYADGLDVALWAGITSGSVSYIKDEIGLEGFMSKGNESLFQSMVNSLKPGGELFIFANNEQSPLSRESRVFLNGIKGFEIVEYPEMIVRSNLQVPAKRVKLVKN